MNRTTTLAALFHVTVLASGCASFDIASEDGGPGRPDAGLDGDVPRDATTATDGGRVADVTPEPMHDAGRDVGLHDAGFDTGLDPSLAIPSADAAPCSPVGNQVVCPLGDCLIVSPSGDAGRCQTCSRTGDDCSGHANAFCDVPEDCDISWACYAHSCHLFCSLETPQTCGSSTCTNVGNATTGVCL